MKIYNMESDEWRKGKFKRQDTWRSNQVYECGVCGVKTNKWIMGGWPGMGPRLICPGSSYVEHKRINELFMQMKLVEKKISDYKKMIKNWTKQTKPDEMKKVINMMENLEAEHILLKNEVQDMRSRFKQVSEVKDLSLKKAEIIIYYPAANVSNPSKKLKRRK